MKSLGIRPGDLIAVTYLKEGFVRQPFRVIRIAPSTNHRTASITAQIHDDAWYTDSNGDAISGAGRQPAAGIGLPRPLIGNVVGPDGEVQFSISEETRTGGDGGLISEMTVGFLAPVAPLPGGPAIPLISLAAQVVAGGSLSAGETFYYAVSGVDSKGQEGGLSFLVMAYIPDGDHDSAIRLSELSFSPGTVSFHVYRGLNPAQLFRIASDVPVAENFVDTGLPPQAIAPPDANYNHANFYWRRELLAETDANIHGPASIGNSVLQLADNCYWGMTVRITHGRGTGQERQIQQNNQTTIDVSPSWIVEPDDTSQFVVAEAGWRLGASATSGPVSFGVPNWTGEVVEICGRSANANGIECPIELSPVARWTIGVGESGDADVPPEPFFGFGLTAGGGVVELSGVSFPSLENTHTISSGTLRLYSWNELSGSSAYHLKALVSASDLVLRMDPPGPASAGDVIQVGAELMRVEEVVDGGNSYRLTRGLHSSASAEHEAGAPVYQLNEKVIVVPFPKAFFGSPYSAKWSYPVPLSNARIASAEFFVTNAKGAGGMATACLTGNVDQGLRTLSGGQYSFQIDGHLAVDSQAAPDLVVEAAHAVRDIFAVVKQAPLDSPVELSIRRNGSAYCELRIEAGATISNVADGFTLGPLGADDRLSLAVLSTGSSLPGADLTVVIRL